ncbi:hypothetical protein DH2020_040489 [Rehmannia glutinosa]|uniref:Endonuclease/exonuclease/phosphatase domain-containing protein n=1 Tax=Rehmannia glutinosa TaxID=99300 RepID=A0ABR0USV3_REHGL
MEIRALWDDLRDSAPNYSNTPWFIGGDFNCFFHESEITGSSTNMTHDMEEFGQMISDCGIVDAGFKGPIHTWVRNSLHERLDRIFLNTKWPELFSKSCVTHLARVKSDHAPLLLNSFVSTSRPPVAFRFFKMWTRHHSFLDNVDQIWKHPTGFNGMMNLHHKLIRVKQKLKWWNKHIFGDVFNNLKKAEVKVTQTERISDDNPTPTNRTALNLSIAELVLATKIEEDYWHQKASCKWIVKGERNTSYFHNLVKQKRLRARIHHIKDNGISITSDAELHKSCVQHFSKVMSNDSFTPHIVCPFPLPQISDYFPFLYSLSGLKKVHPEANLPKIILDTIGEIQVRPDALLENSQKKEGNNQQNTKMMAKDLGSITRYRHPKSPAIKTTAARNKQEEEMH